MEQTERQMITLLRRALSGEPLVALSAEQFEPLYDLAKQHDVLPLVADAAPDERAKNLKAFAVSQYVRQTHDLENVCSAFEEAKIPFIPLKGAVLRDLYPKPWMRSCCDVDILVQMQDLERARACLEAQGYRYGGRTSHDISMLSPNRTQFDLHYNMIEKGSAGNAHAVVQTIWDHASAPAGSVHYVLDDAMLYFYHIAHMAKHFETGGFGVRQFLDLWLLNHRVEYDREKREQLLQEGGLLSFEEAALQLVQVWLSGAPSDERTEIFSDFILCSGVSFNIENRVALGRQRKGGRIRYIWSRLFLPYDRMKMMYPTLQKHPWLLPVMHLKRIGRLVKGPKKKMSRAMREVRVKSSRAEQRDMDLLLEWVGL